MPSKRKKTPEELLRDKLKWEIAEELGLGDKIRENGWGELNAVETGKIGGILVSRLKKKSIQNNNL